MVDPRNIVEKANFRASESIAILHEAEALGISKSQLIRLATLRFLRDRHRQRVCVDLGFIDRPEVGQE